MQTVTLPCPPHFRYESYKVTANSILIVSKGLPYANKILWCSGNTVLFRSQIIFRFCKYLFQVGVAKQHKIENKQKV